MDQLGLDRATARELIGKTAARVVLLDTGVDAGAAALLDEFARFVELPSVTERVGSDYACHFFSRLLLEGMLKIEREESLDAMRSASKQAADKAAALELVSELAGVVDEREAVSRVLDMCMTLFAPGRAVYAALDGECELFVESAPRGTAVESTMLDAFQGDREHVLGNGGFAVRVAHRGETVGILALEDLAFPDYGERYLPLAVTLAKVCGLAVANARRYALVKAAQAELHGEREHLAVTLRSIGDGVIVTDSEGTVTMLNRVAETLTGWQQSDAAGRPLLDVFEIINEKTGEPVEDPVCRVIAEGKIVGLANHTALVRRDGTVLSISDSAAPIRDQSGALVGVVLVFRDVTKARQQERALAESQHDLNRAQAVALTGSWRLDVRKNELLWSDETYRMFGIPKGTAMTYETFLAVVHPDDREHVDQSWRAALLGEPYDIEHRIVVDGQTRWVREKAELEFDKGGSLLGGFGTVQDITHRKQAEKALEEANQQLQDADRRKDEFLAVLSHELRNPLAPIRTSLFVIRKSPPGSDQAHQALNVIGRQLGHLVRLVDDLLDITRISRGKIQLRLERIDLAEVVGRTVEDHRRSIEESGILLKTDVSGKPVRMTGDGTRLAQVAGNLLTNAAKFTPSGGTIEVTLTRKSASTVLTVRDTGVGMDCEMLGRLFQPFTQAPQSLDRSRGGLGLGLALVKSLVELHGGSVSARSDGPGRGAEFNVTLPLAPVSEIAERASAKAVPKPPARRRKVLIIEDNIDGADSLREALELCGHNVRTAYDGPSGIALAKDFRPEVVLCDIGLPGMDGYEVARQLRALPALARTSLVAFTGYALPEDTQRAADAGFAHHIAKPPRIEEIEKLLETA